MKSKLIAEKPDFKIEKGVPLPLAHSNKGYTATIRKLNVGDSVLLSLHQDTVYSLWRSSPDLHGKKFATRSEKGGVRVWRTK